MVFIQSLSGFINISLLITASCYRTYFTFKNKMFLHAGVYKELSIFLEMDNS